MLTVDDYGAIRRARRDGMPIRQIARQFGHTRKTVRHVLKHAEPPAPTVRNRRAPRLGPVEPIIDQILVDDETAPHKQRHTAAQIHRRLRDEHQYPGGYAFRFNAMCSSIVGDIAETFIPLGHLPGQRLEADFGHIYVDFPDGRRLVPFLVTTWAYSSRSVCLGSPIRRRTEAILAEGMVAAFEFFEACPRKSGGITPDRRHADPQRTRTPSSSAVTLHWRVIMCSNRGSACRLAATRSPDAEGTVKAVQKRFGADGRCLALPISDDLNRSLRQAGARPNRAWGRAVTRRHVCDQEPAR